MALDMTVDQQAVDLLRKAEAILNDGGKHWTKGRYRFRRPGEEDRYCAMGALQQAAGLYDESVRDYATTAIRRNLVKRAAALLAQQIRPGVLTAYPDEVVINFNDAHETKWEDVRSKFHAAIKSMKGR